jgi:hypothetical protein
VLERLARQGGGLRLVQIVEFAPDVRLMWIST